MIKKIKTWLPQLAFLYLIAVLFGLWGFLVGGYHFFPYDLLHKPYTNMKAFLKGGAGQNKSLFSKLTTHVQQLENRFEYGGFVQRDKDFIDPGYLLISRFSQKYNQSIVELIKIDGFQVLHQWVPPIKDISAAAYANRNTSSLTGKYRCLHPLLLNDGSLIFHGGTQGPLVRLSPGNEILWSLPGTFHHSIERHNANSIVTITQEWPNFPNIGPDIRDDVLTIISLDGKTLASQPLGLMFKENAYFGLMAGINAIMDNELLHANDIQPVTQPYGPAQPGDYMVSLQRLSSIALIRPKTNDVLWIKTGPWLKQHDIDQLEDGTFSIFNNNSVMLSETDYVMSAPTSSICIWDPKTDKVTEPYQKAFQKADIHSTTEGRSRILPDGDAFVEETQWNRLMRISKDNIRWEWINADPDNPKLSGAINWCRYYLPDEVLLDWLNGK